MDSPEGNVVHVSRETFAKGPWRLPPSEHPELTTDITDPHIELIVQSGFSGVVDLLFVMKYEAQADILFKIGIDAFRRNIPQDQMAQLATDFVAGVDDSIHQKVIEGFALYKAELEQLEQLEA